jgi:AraC-like DNA-binding protein
MPEAHATASAPIRAVVAETGGVRIGRFRCRANDAEFRDSGPACGWLVVFPRTTVWIAQAGRERVLADPACAVLYNAGQEYRREAVSADGDRCEYFSFDVRAVAEAHAAFDPAAVDRLERPFVHTTARVDPSTYLLQRRLFEHITRGGPADDLLVEEAALAILARVVRAAHHHAAPAPPPAPRGHAALVDAVKQLLAARLGEPLQLAAVARAVGRSPFHVARVFRRHAGLGIHAYRTRLRLLASLERVAAGEDLTAIALDLGFSSHSHFTTAFARELGEPPSAFRAAGKKLKAAAARLRAR